MPLSVLTGKKHARLVAIDLRRLVGQGSLVGQARVVRNLRRTSHTRKCQQIRWPLDSQMPEKGDGINNAANMSGKQ